MVIVPLLVTFKGFHRFIHFTVLRKVEKKLKFRWKTYEIKVDLKYSKSWILSFIAFCDATLHFDTHSNRPFRILKTANLSNCPFNKS
jgi:hypothetical protein